MPDLTIDLSFRRLEAIVRRGELIIEAEFEIGGVVCERKLGGPDLRGRLLQETGGTRGPGPGEPFPL